MKRAEWIEEMEFEVPVVVMLGDAVNAKKATGEAKETLEVIDVSQLLVHAVQLRAGATPRDVSE